jgi:PPM family protein phosphatase
MFVSHVGDSRAYRVREGKIEQLTRDHSLVNDYLAAMPDMTDEQRSELPKNVITRALGMQDNVEVDIQNDECRLGDAFILCSDGLSGMITDNEIQDAVSSSDTLEQACRRLVAMANEHGGEDNITAVVIRIVDDAATRNLEFSTTQPGIMPSTELGDPLEDTPPAAAQADPAPPSRP